MSEKLCWAGPNNLEEKSAAFEAFEIAALLDEFFALAEKLSGEASSLSPELGGAFERWTAALSLARPIFSMAPHRRAASAAAIHSVLTGLAVAEAKLFAEMARVRAAWIYNALRDASALEDQNHHV